MAAVRRQRNQSEPWGSNSPAGSLANP